MSTIAEKNQLLALHEIASAVTPLQSAIDSISVNVDNSDVVHAIQNFSYAALMAKLDSLIAAVNAKSPIIKASVARVSEIISTDLTAGKALRLFPVNLNRVGFFIYNNSTNSLYFGPTNSPAGSKVFGQLATNAGPTALQAFLGPVVWTGEIWVVRNSGTGGVVGYELET